MKLPEHRKAYFTWVEMGVLFQGLKKKAAQVRVAVCSETQRIALIAGTPVMVLMVRDAYIERRVPDGPEVCEESRACFDVDCPLNRLTWEGYKSRMGVRMRKPPAGFGQRISPNVEADGSLRSFPEFARDRGGVVIIRERGHGDP